MSEPEVIAVGTTCPVCGETFYVPEPKYSELIQQLVRVARAANKLKELLELPWQQGHVTEIEREIIEALSALPEGMLDE